VKIQEKGKAKKTKKQKKGDISYHLQGAVRLKA
jgi:hypothetical protein